MHALQTLPGAECHEQAMCTWMMAKATTSCPEAQIPCKVLQQGAGSSVFCIDRRGHFVYDKLSFDGQELVSERLAQLTATLRQCAGTEVAMWLNGRAMPALLAF